MSEPSGWYQAGLSASAPELYERCLVPAIFGPWAEDLVVAAAPRPGERVLDVACGTGVVAQAAARRVGATGTVVGLDLNRERLAVASALPAGEGAVIAWRQGDAAALPFPERSFDVVVCQQGLQFFPDRATALGEMRRVLVPGGRLALSVWLPIARSPGFAILAAALDRHISPRLLDGPFSLGDAAELRTLLIGAGFRDVTVSMATRLARFPSAAAFVEGYLAASFLAGLVAQVDARARAAFVADACAGLEPYEDAAGLAFPMESHLATART
jgi:SAM-dependent methyltransferase